MIVFQSFIPNNIHSNLSYISWIYIYILLVLPPDLLYHVSFGNLFITGQSGAWLRFASAQVTIIFEYMSKSISIHISFTHKLFFKTSESVYSPFNLEIVNIILIPLSIWQYIWFIKGELRLYVASAKTAKKKSMCQVVMF